jgi:predicted DNA-binding helix-hairpin-helix protein
VDLNTAERERMLRTPGLGVRSVDRMLEVRRLKALTLEDVRRLTRGIEKLKPFIVTADWTPGALTDRADLRERVAPRQMALF